MPDFVAASLAAAPALPLAAGKAAGGSAFLIVIVLIVAAIGLFIAMSGSLKRLRRRVERGTFGQPGESSGEPRVDPGEEEEEAEPSSAPPAASAPAGSRSAKRRAASRDPEGPGGEGA